MRSRSVLLLAVLLAAPLQAQQIVADEELLASDRPEAWAMNYAMASSVMTAFGELPALAPGEWRVAAELGHIPGLSDEQSRVGFGGEKAEDLDKSPVFGRGRIVIGLPGAWIAELGYTPPLRIDGARTRDLFALALGRRVLQRDAWTLSARAFGQHGKAEGDITCPASVAGPFDPVRNPFGCVAASKDTIDLNYYGADLTAAWGADWRWHATAGLVRTEPVVQVDALVFTVRDRSRLVARGVLPVFAFGATRTLGRDWQIAAELMHVPIDVRREANEPARDDAFTGLRLRLGFAPPR
jgi:hypothetical protein